jgi:xylulokinase
MSHILGLDVSTTATKAVLLDPDGVVQAVAAAEYTYETPRAGWTEQDPGLWWDGAVRAIRSALAEGGVSGDEIDGVGLAGQMHGLVTLDGRGELLRPAILWNDQRTQAECDLIRKTLGRERLIAVTGNDALTGFTAPKLLWVQRHEPEVWSRIAHVLLPKDYVRFRLTGDLAVDKADGAGTLLFDLPTRDWSSEVAKALGVDEAWLPTTYEGPDVTGVVSAEAAAATGLRPGTPVVAGGGDQAAAAVGVGAVEPGVLSVSLGTSGVVFATTEGAVVERNGRLHAFCHAVPGCWHVMGVMLSAAGSLRWYRDALAPGLDFADLVAEAEAAPPGSDGLVFLPYLTGERTPHPDPFARGAFVGLTVRHTRAHLTRAVLEGVTFGLRDSLELIRSLDAAGTADAAHASVASGAADVVGASGAAPQEPHANQPVDGQRGQALRVTGGGSASVLWRQILADVTGLPVATTSTSEGAAQGAAMLAAVGVGWFPSVPDACRTLVGLDQVVDPSADGSVASTYADRYDHYRALYPALSPTFHALGSEPTT